MKVLSTLFTTILLVVAAYSQCGPRYHQIMFTDSVATDIPYGSNVSVNGNTTNLDLDIYFPAGDNATDRPLVIIAHGGNFLSGSSTGGDVVPICQHLAQMGYVAASINYRKGMQNFPFPGPDSTDAAEAVVRASHDGKAAVRFFRASFENGNPYGIDTSKIFFSGVSAGGFIALNVGYFDDINEFPTFIDTVNEFGLTGGIEGNSGNPGYSSSVAGVINLCGAIRDTAWIDAGDVPVLSFHGDQDQTVPYGTETITLLGTYPLLIVSGSGSIAIRADEMGITNCLETHEGQDHTPHLDNGPYYDTTINIMRNFLVHLVCNDPLDCNYGAPITSTYDMSAYEGFNVYPNPAHDVINIELPEENSSAELVISDLQGRIVISKTMNWSEQINVEQLASGTYLIRINQNGRLFGGRVMIK